MIVDSIERFRKMGQQANGWGVTAHPMLVKKIIREHVAAECREAGYEVWINYSQCIGADRVVVWPSVWPLETVEQ